MNNSSEEVKNSKQLWWKKKDLQDLVEEMKVKFIEF